MKFIPSYLAENLEFSDIDYVDTWKAMENLVHRGLAKNIGVSNFNSSQIGRIISNCSIIPTVNQVECHPYFAQIKLSDYCKTNGIALTAYCPLGSPQRPWAKQDDPTLLEDPKINKMAAKYSKTPAQVVLRYQVSS